MHNLPVCVFMLMMTVGIPLIAAENPEFMTSADLADLENPPADVRITYGPDPLQFADLRLPDGEGPHPVIILIHGGCWLSEFDITHTAKLARAFANNGIASWSLEYRRVGNPGGGWPGTFQDILHGADRLLAVSKNYQLDTRQVIAVGHSAGGQLALWLAARGQYAASPLFHSPRPVSLQGVLALAPAPDLARLHEAGVCGNVIAKLMGGAPNDYPKRYKTSSPPELLPLGLPQIIITGVHDHAWQQLGVDYAALARQAGDRLQLINAPESGHFEMIDPDSTSWPLVLRAARELLGL